MTDPIHILFCVSFSFYNIEWDLGWMPRPLGPVWGGHYSHREVGKKRAAWMPWWQWKGITGGLCMAWCQSPSWLLVQFYYSAFARGAILPHMCISIPMLWLLQKKLTRKTKGREKYALILPHQTPNLSPCLWYWPKVVMWSEPKPLWIVLFINVN